jgi:Fe-Mn family superoxide dismutase
MTDQTYSLPELSYDPAALEPHLSGRIIELHYFKHHAAYVKGANATLERLCECRSRRDFTTMAALERSLAFYVSGHVLHSMLWSNMSPRGGGEPSGDLADQLEETFGSGRLFRQQMTQAAGTLQGSGWALASWEPVAGRVVVQQVYDHAGNHGQGTIPLLAIDAWEHAYYLQYENRKAEYFDAVWNVIDWDDVSRRFERARVAARAGSVTVTS